MIFRAASRHVISTLRGLTELGEGDLNVIFRAASLHAGMILANFFTEITRVSRLSSRFARDNFLKFAKILSGSLKALKITFKSPPSRPLLSYDLATQRTAYP